MEKSQYKLCIEILRRLQGAGVLDDMLVIGSWCGQFYSNYFRAGYDPSIKTRDIDFLIPMPSNINAVSDVPKLVEDLGFVVDHRGAKGYIRLLHPELIIEFLVPEKGRGTDKPVLLPRLKINAQALRFLEILTQDTVKVSVGGVSLRLPHPANFAIHKLIISGRRQNKDKAAKDRASAVDILRALINKGESAYVKSVFKSFPKKWQKKVTAVLDAEQEMELMELLRQE